MTVKQLKKGEFFTRRPIENPTEKQVFIRGEYDRAAKKYECARFDDISSAVYLSGDKEIFTDFTF